MRTDETRYGTGEEEVRHGVGEADKPIFQSGQGDPVNEPAASARWGPENARGIWAGAVGFLVIVLTLLVVLILVF